MEKKIRKGKLHDPYSYEIETWIAKYTPEWAESVSGIAAKDIRRIGLEFAAVAPAAVAFTNRGSLAYYNGFNNDRAVILLNAIVGSIGAVGGYCFGEEPTHVPPRVFPNPQPIPPAAKAESAIENPEEWRLARHEQAEMLRVVRLGTIRRADETRVAAPRHLQVECAHARPHTIAKIPVRNRAPQPHVDQRQNSQ